MATIQDILPGQHIKITHQHPRGTGDLLNVVEGTVIRFGQSKTGSWYAHSKDGKLWLDRVELKKSDGELVVCNLDQYTTIDVVS
jgi:hypothetical protein